MSERTKKWLAIICTVAVFGILAVLIFVEIPENNKDIVNTTFSAIIGGTIVIAFTYYFGDSDRNN
jgi:uncharacterized membrane-anchored protein